MAENDTQVLSRNAILGADDLKTETIRVPEWGGSVRVRGLRSAERDAYEQELYLAKVDDEGKLKAEKNFSNAKARLVVRCVIDEDGDRVFTDADAAELGDKNAIAVNRVFQRVQALSGMGAEAAEKIEGNSEAGRSDVSPSLSPATSG